MWIAESRLSLATSQMALYPSKRRFRLRPGRRILFPQKDLHADNGMFVTLFVRRRLVPCNLLLALSDCFAMRTDALLVSAIRRTRLHCIFHPFSDMFSIVNPVIIAFGTFGQSYSVLFVKLPSAAAEHSGPAPNARHRTLRPLSNGIGSLLRQETSMRGMT